MEILDYRVILYFQKVSPYNILRGDFSYNDFEENNFKNVVRYDLENISETETDDICSYLEKHNEGEAENGLHVFRTLKTVANKYLMMQNDAPVCLYDSILDWRELVEGVGEDLLICAFCANYTERTGRVWSDFTWNPIIQHDNMQLNRIMQRGISDNHFHLFGSAPAFKLIWIRLMNDFEDANYVTALGNIENERRMTGRKYFSNYQESSFRKMRFQAAVIRLYLIFYIDKMRNGKVDAEKEAREQDKIQHVLLEEGEGYQYYGELETYIEGCRLSILSRNNVYVDDYACVEYDSSVLNSEFSGERRFIYQMLWGQVDNQRIPDKLMNWFYAYLVIKSIFRREFTQVNKKVGFENFSQYSRRKSNFLDKPYDMEQMVKLAVGESLNSGNVQTLELRISPENNAIQNRNLIQECDRYIRENLDDALDRTYYVFHFPKERDQMLECEDGIVDTCRHYYYRKRLELKSEGIINFRNYYPEQAQRVKGIDACAQELYCRPEVFGPVFRRLRYHIVSNEGGQAVHQLRATYHVGEDWHDIVDGLRAIDEAILYLNLTNGERLGHATVLGIDIADWYEKKNGEFWISYQDYLDNVVWLYNKLIQFDIRDCEALKGQLMSEFERCYQAVFGSAIIDENIRCSMHTYYESWKLRGDDPEMYRTGEFVHPNGFQTFYCINSRIEDGNSLRNDRAIAALVYYYHYSASVRYNGYQTMHAAVSDLYVNGVKLVQKAMQQYVSRMGIFVETNPSSNYKISTIDKYEKHPIAKFYNMGLTWNERQLRLCPQIHASINTDDRGVFDTSAENEYALIGCAMEHMKNSDGEYLYNRQMVYDWLDRIRENGNQQSFL